MGYFHRHSQKGVSMNTKKVTGQTSRLPGNCQAPHICIEVNSALNYHVTVTFKVPHFLSKFRIRVGDPISGAQDAAHAIGGQGSQLLNFLPHFNLRT